MIITAPGAYRARNGHRVEVEYVSAEHAFGYDRTPEVFEFAGPMTWRLDGFYHLTGDHQSPLDLIAPWVDIPEGCGHVWSSGRRYFARFGKSYRYSERTCGRCGKHEVASGEFPPRPDPDCIVAEHHANLLKVADACGGKCVAEYRRLCVGCTYAQEDMLYKPRAAPEAPPAPTEPAQGASAAGGASGDDWVPDERTVRACISALGKKPRDGWDDIIDTLEGVLPKPAASLKVSLRP